MATTRTQTPALTSRLTYVLKQALVHLDQLHAELLAPLGITGRELGVLLLLRGSDPTSQQQAAERLGADRTTMVGLVDALEAKGLVERRPDVEDRRRNVLELTDRGTAVLTQAVRASDKAERRLLAGLDAAEAAQLRALLARVGPLGAQSPT